MRTLTKRQREVAESSLRVVACDLADLLRDMDAKSAVVRVWVDNRGCTMMSGRMHDGAGGHTLPTELVAVREEIA